jgi:flavin reductase (DIM6/NTAB) family NADH-FMN oxidoreductase RutF
MNMPWVCHVLEKWVDVLAPLAGDPANPRPRRATRQPPAAAGDLRRRRHLPARKPPAPAPAAKEHRIDPTLDERLRYRTVIGHFATGVCVITGQAPTGPGGMTANALCSLSLDPLLLLVCFENTARTLPIIRSSGRFAVNVLASGQRETSLVFASKLAEADKFADVDYQLRAGVPVLAGTLAWLVCDLREFVAAGDHEIAIGAVTQMGHSPDREPLLWYGGRYRTLAADPANPPGSPTLHSTPDPA